MILIDILLEQVAIETGVDIADMMIVTNPGPRKVLRIFLAGATTLYIVSDVLICNRCHHTWRPEGDRPPNVCPKCKSPYWNKPRKFIRPEAAKTK